MFNQNLPSLNAFENESGKNSWTHKTAGPLGIVGGGRLCLDKYEGSFGSYDVDEGRHTLTHHVQGSNTRDLLVGKDLPRVYQFTADGKLIIRSARPDEHWSVTWEHY